MQVIYRLAILFAVTIFLQSRVYALLLNLSITTNTMSLPSWSFRKDLKSIEIYCQVLCGISSGQSNSERLISKYSSALACVAVLYILGNVYSQALLIVTCSHSLVGLSSSQVRYGNLGICFLYNNSTQYSLFQYYQPSLILEKSVFYLPVLMPWFACFFSKFYKFCIGIVCLKYLVNQAQALGCLYRYKLYFLAGRSINCS